MMDVPPVRSEDRLAPEKATRDRDERVEYGEPQRHDRNRDRDHRGSFCALSTPIPANMNPRNRLPESPRKIVAG